MNTEYGYYFPEDIILFSQNESGNFTGKKNNITYKNENGKIVKANDYSGDPKTIKNEIVSKFIINKSRTTIKNEYSSFHGITLYDEKREFEFEISATNFMNLCIFGKVNHGAIEVECVFAFGNNGYPILLPVDSTQYKKAVKFTEKRQSVFSGELVVGKIYSMKKKSNKVAYLGKFKTDLEVNWTNIKNQDFFSVSENKDIFYINNRPTGKDIFVNLDANNDYDQFISMNKSSIFEEIDDLESKKLDSYIKKYIKNNSFFTMSGIKLEKFDNNSDNLKFYSLFEDEKEQQALLLCVDSKYSNSYSFNYSDIKKGYAKPVLIFKNKNNLELVGSHNIHDLLPKEFIIVCEKIFGFDEEKRVYNMIKVSREMKKTYSDYVGFEEIDVPVFFEKLLDKKIEEKQIVMKGDKGEEVMKHLLFKNERIGDMTFNAISSRVASNFYNALRRN